ncbi:hypothetical protein ACFWXO_18865 [Kitasatospora sp. NPDC059088]|uniref:hypothetical protein n=1 Tax=Kitasatospora sp. NPDC059088 TaxID=3346722 RepID=UPI00368E8044
MDGEQAVFGAVDGEGEGLAGVDGGVGVDGRRGLAGGVAVGGPAAWAGGGDAVAGAEHAGEVLRGQRHRAVRARRSRCSPTEVSNASSTRARLIIDALRTPVVVTRTNARRSSALNATGYFFCEDTAPLPAERKRHGSQPDPNSTKKNNT